MYDLHVHIIGHDRRIRDYSSAVDKYVLQAEMLGLKALGFVDHYPYRLKNVQKVKEKVEYYKKNANIPVWYGAEIYLPSNTKIPKYFDYSVGHVRAGYSLEEAFKMVRQKRIDVIAHPCAYGARCSHARLEQYKDSGICLEISEKGLLYFPQWLYEKAVELDIPLPLGSDAHSPDDLGFPGVLERGLKWTPLENIPFVEDWL